MAKCQNCQNPISCSCQIRIATDKKSCCANCIKQYEQSLKAKELRLQTVIPVISNIHRTEITVDSKIL